MVICESHRINAWKALAGGYQLLAVEKCLEEATTGDSSRPGYVEVDVEKIRKDFVMVFDPGRREQAELVLRLPGDIQLDPGERHLLAAATSLTNSIAPTVHRERRRVTAPRRAPAPLSIFRSAVEPVIMFQ